MRACSHTCPPTSTCTYIHAHTRRSPLTLAFSIYHTAMIWTCLLCAFLEAKSNFASICQPDEPRGGESQILQMRKTQGLVWNMFYNVSAHLLLPWISLSAIKSKCYNSHFRGELSQSLQHVMVPGLIPCNRAWLMIACAHPVDSDGTCSVGNYFIITFPTLSKHSPPIATPFPRTGKAVAPSKTPGILRNT